MSDLHRDSYTAPDPYGGVWFRAEPDHSATVWDELKGITISRDATGTFTGYFHYVPDKKARMQSVFDPGPFQLQVTDVSDVHILHSGKTH